MKKIRGKKGGFSGLLRRWFGVFSDPEDFERDEAPGVAPLLAVLTRLRLAAGSPAGLPAPFAAPLRALCRALGVFSVSPDGSAGQGPQQEPPRELAALLAELEELADSLSALEQRLQERPSYAWDDETDALFSAVAQMSGRLAALARQEAPGFEPGAEGTAQQEEISRRRALLPATMKLRASIAALESRRGALPEATGACLGEIASEARAIIETMESEPEAIKSGSRFLTRYLAAALNILEQFDKLRESAPDPAALERIAQQTHSLIVRLAEAFRDERRALSDRDLLSLSADLSVLDKLLKMEGH